MGQKLDKNKVKLLCKKVAIRSTAHPSWNCPFVSKSNHIDINIKSIRKIITRKNSKKNFDAKNYFRQKVRNYFFPRQFSPINLDFQ